MSKVYHGSIEEVKCPEIRLSLLAIRFVESKRITL